MYIPCTTCLHILLAHSCLYYYLLSLQYTVLHSLFYCTFNLFRISFFSFYSYFYLFFTSFFSYLYLCILLSWIWLPLTTTAHHPWTTSPIMHCTHTFPSTITSITQLSPFTHQPWLPHHTCTSFTHSHKSSTQTLTQCEVLFFPWLTFPSVFPSLSSRVLPGLLTPSPDCLLPASLTLPAFW